MAEIWVVDTSSIIAVRRDALHNHQPAVFTALSGLVIEERLVYPRQVVKELERNAHEKDDKPDLPCRWAVSNKAIATRFPTDFTRSARG